MDTWYSAEIEGELLLIGIVSIIGAFIYYKLDMWMGVHERTNELLEKLLEKDGAEASEKGDEDKNEG